MELTRPALVFGRARRRRRFLVAIGLAGRDLYVSFLYHIKMKSLCMVACGNKWLPVFHVDEDNSGPNNKVIYGP